MVHDDKQVLSKVDYNIYEDLGIETNIINPNLQNALELEKKSLRQSMVKNILFSLQFYPFKHLKFAQHLFLMKKYYQLIRYSKDINKKLK